MGYGHHKMQNSTGKYLFIYGLELEIIWCALSTYPVNYFLEKASVRLNFPKKTEYSVIHQYRKKKHWRKCLRHTRYTKKDQIYSKRKFPPESNLIKTKDKMDNDIKEFIMEAENILYMLSKIHPQSISPGLIKTRGQALQN